MEYGGFNAERLLGGWRYGSGHPAFSNAPAGLRRSLRVFGGTTGREDGLDDVHRHDLVAPVGAVLDALAWGKRLPV